MSKVVVVGGGGTGIGAAVARRFAKDGDSVVLVGRRESVLEETAADIGRLDGSGAVDWIAADLAEPDQVGLVRSAVAGRYGRVSVLVNCAGGNRLIGPADRYPGLRGTAGHWLDNFRANVLTAVLLTEAVRDLLDSPGGRVIMLSSIAAYRGSGSGSYGAAKAALHPYVYNLAAALGPSGITVNAIAPGYVAGTEFYGGELPPERRERMVAQTSDGRAGTPDDIASTVHWLASGDAAHITAQIIQVNGGAERGR